jgi:hypothetical protein
MIQQGTSDTSMLILGGNEDSTTSYSIIDTEPTTHPSVSNTHVSDAGSHCSTIC